MWDYVIVGKGERLSGAGCVPYGSDSHSNPSVSENRVSYWISDCFVEGKGMTIFKGTSEGKKLKALLEEGNERNIVKFIGDTFLKNISLAKLRTMIRETEKEHFHKGQEYAQMQMRVVLGLE